ncbi:MAG: hypothetical protein KC547_13230 [Anaerolineae bacterium]|nr:hypothetical protein [Anaerolineae bacterium]
MDDEQRFQERPRGILYRLVQALTGILILACLISGYLGLRAIVWRRSADLPALLSSGLTIAFVVGLVLGGFYLIFGARGMRFVLNFNWMSVQLGLVFGMLLYGIANAITPLLPTYAREDFVARGLQGAVDGALIGAFAGAIVSLIDRKPVLLTRFGITRYTLLFLLVLIILAAIITIGNQPQISRNVAFWLFVPAVLILRLLVSVYDRWRDNRYVRWDDWDENLVE